MNSYTIDASLNCIYLDASNEVINAIIFSSEQNDGKLDLSTPLTRCPKRA